MAGKMRVWAKSVPPSTKQKMWAQLKEAGVNEARFARDDIRQKLIEEGWSGSVQTPRGIKTYAADVAEEGPAQGTAEVASSPIETDWESRKADALETASIHTSESAIAWEEQKATAEALYGHDGNYQGTVWQNEQQNGIEPPAQENQTSPDVQPPDAGIEPD